MGFELICAKCGVKFIKETGYYNYHQKHHYHKFYCSQECQRSDQLDLKIFVKCLNCRTEFHKPNDQVQKFPNHFCSKSCSATYNNNKRPDKSYKCISCGIDIVGSAGLGQPRAKCKNCKKKALSKRRLQPRFKDCIKCGRSGMLSERATLCVECRLSIRSEVGRLNGMKQHTNRRSKNEILFAELCKTCFPDVLENPKMFDGWDADVVIPSIKVAVAWNGPWHYKDKIRHNHSLKQIQNRDRLKAKHIAKHGYSLYVIKDISHGFNSEFVGSEFDKFYELHKP